MERLQWPVAAEIVDYVFLKHVRVTVSMNLATVQHHSFMKSTVVEVGVQVGSPLRYDHGLSSAPAPAVTTLLLDPVSNTRRPHLLTCTQHQLP